MKIKNIYIYSLKQIVSSLLRLDLESNTTFWSREKLKLGREQVVTATHTHIFLVGGPRSGPSHSTDKCLAPARPQSALTGQQIRRADTLQICFSLCATK